MKLRYAKNDDIVTVWFGLKRYAVAEARDLKAAGYANRQAIRGHLDEWTLWAKSWRDFQRMQKSIPPIPQDEIQAGAV